jgi:PAS domain S-box-containing protein
MPRSTRTSRVAADRYRSLFQYSIVPMWEEDISGLRELLAQWTARKERDLRAHLRQHPALVRKGVRAIRVVDVNEAALRLYEAERKKELLGPLNLLLDAEALDRFIELFAAIAEGRSWMESESSARTLKGRRLEVLVREFIPSPQDDHPSMIVTVVDFTEYRRLEGKFREEQSIVRAVIDSVPDLIFIKDLRGRFLLANRALADWAGKASADDLIGKTDYDFFPKEVADSYAKVDTQIIESGTGRTGYEEEVVSADGLRQWALTSKMPFRDASGAPAGIIGIVRDITERKRLQLSTEGERALLREVIDDLPDAIFVKDKDGRFILANKAAAEIMQVDGPEALIGRTDADFYPAQTAGQSAPEERAVIQEGRKIINKLEPRTVRGVKRWVLTTKVPLFDADGTITGLVGIDRDITSLQEALDALERSEERYRSLVEDIGVGILSADQSGTITFANSVAGQIFGLPKGYSVGKNIREFLSDEEYARVREEMGRRSREDKSSYEVNIVRTDGERRRILITAVSRFDQEDRYMGTFATMQDVTDRHAVEAELARQRAFMQALMDNLPDYIYFKDRESRFILNNKAHAKELGAADPVDMLGRTDFDYFAEEHARKAFNDEQRIVRTGEPLINDVEKETWTNRPPSWVSTTKMPLRDEQGKIIGTFGVSRDMTERRRMEEKNLRLAAMIESSNDAIISIGLDDTVTSWNKGAENIFGYSAEEMMGTSIIPLLSPQVMMQEPTLREQMGREGRVLHTESTVMRKDGRRIYVSTSTSVITDAEGQMVGITFISRDVTDQKALQVQLIRAQRLESLGTLAAGIAHQFNNINTAVRGYLDILSQDTGLPASARSYVRKTLKAVQRAVDITDRLQGLTTSASSTSPEVLRLEEAVPAIVALFAKTLEREGIRLEVDIPQTPAVRVSHAMLEFLVTSLMTNSIHALSGCASPLVAIRGRCKAGFCSLEVTDNGCGISAENLPRIFTPFFTTKGEWAEPGSRQAMVKGIGLSLAVCQSSVAENGGWIEVESPPDGGATFRVWLPAASQDTFPDTGS